MNTFYEHHHDSIRFGYRCFARILLNGLPCTARWSGDPQRACRADRAAT